jgi:hypothetical protein
MIFDDLEDIVERTKMRAGRTCGRGPKESILTKRNLGRLHSFRTRIKIAQQVSEIARKKKAAARV